MWMTFLTRHDLLCGDKMPKNLDDPRLKKAVDVLNVMNFTEEERMSYEDRLHWLRIETNTLKKYEEKALERGREEGRQEGLEEGRQEGEKIGIEKATLHAARILKQQGVASSIIALSTGLSESVIEKL
jgi:predicted transposase/invertase (TIGR01784 family)